MFHNANSAAESAAVQATLDYLASLTWCLPDSCTAPDGYGLAPHLGDYSGMNNREVVRARHHAHGWAYIDAPPILAQIIVARLFRSCRMWQQDLFAEL